MIAVVAAPGELRDALLGRLPSDTRVVEPGDDPIALSRALEGVERMFLACDDDTAAADVVAAAEMALVYLCVSLHPVEALSGSALRSRILLDEAPGAPADPDALADLAARALVEDPPPP